MLDGMDEGREVLVLLGAAAADPRRGIEEEIKLLIRYRGRPPSSGSIALISYAPAAALGAAEGRR